MQLCMSVMRANMQFNKPRNLFCSHFGVTLPSLHHPGKRYAYGRLWKTIFITEDKKALKICLLNIDLGFSQEQMVF